MVGSANDTMDELRSERRQEMCRVFTYIYVVVLVMLRSGYVTETAPLNLMFARMEQKKQKKPVDEVTKANFSKPTQRVTQIQSAQRMILWIK